jgi:multiple sugar transport system substrate-binding protein
MNHNRFLKQITDYLYCKSSVNRLQSKHQLNLRRKRMKLKKQLLAVVMIFVLSLSFTGCGDSSSQATEQETGQETTNDSNANKDTQAFNISSETTGEITVWDWNSAYEEKMYSHFQEVYPNIKVNYVTVAHGDYMQKLQSAIATGTDVPDIILGEGAWRGKLFDMDILDNLEAEPYNLSRDDMFDYLVAGMSNARGEIVGVDQSIAPAGFAYKRDLALEYLGTDNPDEVYEHISSWDKFIETGKKISEESNGSINMLPGFGDVLYATKGQTTQDYVDGDTIDITKRMSKALETAIKVRDADIVGDNELDTPSWNAEFAENETIFFPAAPWSCEWHVAANDPDGAGNWGLTKAPESGYTKGGTSVGIYSKSENKEAAFAYLQWVYFSIDGSIVSRDVIGQYSSLKACYEGDNPIYNEAGAYDEFFGGQNLAKYFVEEIVPNIESTQNESAYETIVNEVFNKLNPTLSTDKTITAEEAIELYKEEIAIKAMDAEVK